MCCGGALGGGIGTVIDPTCVGGEAYGSASGSVIESTIMSSEEAAITDPNLRCRRRRRQHRPNRRWKRRRLPTQLALEAVEAAQDQPCADRPRLILESYLPNGLTDSSGPNTGSVRGSITETSIAALPGS